MTLVYLLLISGAVGMVLYQPHYILFVPAGGSVNISCFSNHTHVLNEIGRISWYRKTWRDGDTLTRVASCVTKSSQTYSCRLDTNGATVTLFNVHREDSGMYYCSSLHLSSLFFANGTMLIAGDNSNASIVGYLLITPQQPTCNRTIQLACAVRMPLPTGHVTWNISGTHYMGRTTSIKFPDGTWTFMNLLSLPRDTWDYGDNVTCEVWFSSSPVQFHWTIPYRGAESNWFGSCYSWLSSALITAFLLIGVAYVRLIWMKTKPVNTGQTPNASKNKDFVDEDGIVYTELHFHITSKNQE